MKREYLIATVVLFLLGLMFVSLAHADYYVVNLDNEVVSKTNYKPSQKDLDKRNEIAVYSVNKIKLKEAEYRNGRIVVHTETLAEKEVKEKHAAKGSERQLIRNKAMKTACKALEIEGTVFKHINCDDL